MVKEKMFSWEEDFDLRPGKSLIKYLRMVSKEIGDFKDNNDNVDRCGGCDVNNFNSDRLVAFFDNYEKILIIMMPMMIKLFISTLSSY